MSFVFEVQHTGQGRSINVSIGCQNRTILPIYTVTGTAQSQVATLMFHIGGRIAVALITGFSRLNSKAS